MRWLTSAARERGNVAWFAALLATTCFEGLGRKFLPFVPAVLFYFLKDVVLLAGLVSFGLRGDAVAGVRRLYRRFVPVAALAVLWTVLQVFNPEHRSALLALIGLRSYWLWWIAPIVIANALRSREDRERAVLAFATIALFIAGYASLQFNSAPDAIINAYSYFGGEARTEVAVVGTTGRARVASTFAYLSGFADFGALVPALLLALGVDAERRSTRVLASGSAVLVLATIAMTGSRMGLSLSLLGMAMVVVSSGFVRTRPGRWAVGVAVLAVLAVLSIGADALQGVKDRWQGDDTAKRISDVWQVLPPVALSEAHYPLLGIGTGMQQNARFQVGGVSEWDSEEEPGRYLVELGVPGYLLVWIARFGLVVGLLKMAATLHRAGCRGPASAAVAYATLTMLGRLTFDHVWQALYFVGVGVLLSHYVAVRFRGAPAAVARRSSAS